MVAYIVDGSIVTGRKPGTVSVASSRSYGEPFLLGITALALFRFCAAVIFNRVGLYRYIWEGDG